MYRLLSLARGWLETLQELPQLPQVYRRLSESALVYAAPSVGCEGIIERNRSRGDSGPLVSSQMRG